MPGYRGRRQGPPLTPPGELVGRFVKWSPKGADGRRRPAVYGWCDAFDAEARTLTMRVAVEATPWNGGASERTVSVPLSSGPFSVVS